MGAICLLYITHFTQTAIVEQQDICFGVIEVTLGVQYRTGLGQTAFWVSGDYRIGVICDFPLVGDPRMPLR